MQKVWRYIPFWGVLALLIYMPFHVFLSQSLSLLTGGLDIWKLGKDALLAILVLFTICLVWWKRRGVPLFNWFVVLGAAYVLLHLLVWLLHPAIYRDSALLGLIYNNRLFGYFLLAMGSLLLIKPERVNLVMIYKVLLGVSTLVAIMGVAQYFLPKDILTHFGYGPSRGTLAAFFIDNKANFPRIMSTLRDPNSLGAYLFVPITLLVALLVRVPDIRRRLGLTVLLVLHLAALFLTFSRGAWAAAVTSVGLVLLWEYGAFLGRLVRRWWPALLVLVLLFSAGLFAARHTYVLKSVVTHSTGKPQAAYDSNGFHWVFAKRGLEGIVRNPFGHGPGTAGLASIQNPKGSFLTENYYIQIGYEVGVPGLALFLFLNAWVYWLLWQRRHGNVLVLVLLASFWAYVVMNMLFQMWSNEAVAAQWWLLAGVTAALPVGGVVRSKRPAAR